LVVEFQLDGKGSAASEKGHSVCFRQDFFGEAFCRSFSSHVCQLLASGLSPESETLPLMSLHYVTPSERASLVQDWDTPYDEHSVQWPPQGGADFLQPQWLVHELFETVARRRPSAIALKDERRELTYRELSAAGDALAGYLMSQQGVRPGDIVGLYMPKSANVVVSMLGVIKAGATYLPLDPAYYPLPRLRMCVADSGCKVLLCTKSLREAASSALEGGVSMVDVVQDVPETATAEGRKAMEGVRDALKGDLGCYMEYTSGSTGKPKGVVVMHYNVATLFCSCYKDFRFDEQAVMLMFHSMSFDMHAYEVWGTLLFGGRIVVFAEGHDPTALWHACRQHSVTHLSLTPAVMYNLAQADAELGPKYGNTGLASLRCIELVGEALDFGRMRPWFARHDGVRCIVVNTYGITETTVINTWHKVMPREASALAPSNIGRALPNTQMVLVDKGLEPVPHGIVGEMALAGDCVSKGYHGNAELTRARFLRNHPCVSERWPEHSRVLYLTGDRCYFDPSLREFVFVGRLDSQIKHLGYRLEAQEVEATLCKHKDVKEAAVVSVPIPGSSNRLLVGYVVPQQAEAQQVTSQLLHDHLRQFLPAQMVPNRFVVLPQGLPLSSNQKVNKKLLADPATLAQLSGTSLAADSPGADEDSGPASLPANPIEELVCSVFASALALQRQPSVNATFFGALGGDSSAALRTVAVLRSELQIHIPATALFQNPKPKQLAAHLAELLQTKASTALPHMSVMAAPTRKQQQQQEAQPEPPIVFVNGNVLYESLGKHLQQLMPGRRMLALDGTNVQRSTFADFISLCLDSVLQHCDSRVCLVGHSFGGLVAYELAHALLARGREVTHLVIVDISPTRNFTPADLAGAMSSALVGSSVSSALPSAQMVSPIKMAMHLDFIHAVSKSYQPRPLPDAAVRVMYVQPTEEPESPYDWLQISGCKNTEHTVIQGNHFGVLQPPLVSNLCTAIGAFLKK
jgi:amino acid adenylation domain-containing protein